MIRKKREETCTIPKWLMFNISNKITIVKNIFVTNIYIYKII